jgi:ABC-type antimicrobial peptide transport system permease subunit
MLDRLAADRLWPARLAGKSTEADKGSEAGKGSQAVGKHIQLLAGSGANTSQDVEVVGVVANVQEQVFGGGLQPHVYVPFGQEYQADMNIHLKLASQGGNGAGSDANFLETARREVGSVDSRLPVLALRTMRDHLDASFDLWIVRTAARMFSIFGGVALLLAMVGLYSLRAYTVARRTREIGIRLALGAQPSDARQMILREGLVVTAIGAGSGLVLSLLAGRVLTSLLYKVSGVDPLVFLSSAAILGMVSLLACYLPALRASRVDPMIALRHD